MLIIGSEALAHNKIIYQGREVRDLDIIGTLSEMKVFISQHKVLSSYPSSSTSYVIKTKEKGIVEWEIAFQDSSGYKLLLLCDAMEGVHYAKQDVLYTLKMSHRFKKDSPHFYKTMEDILYLRNIGCRIFNKDWFLLREKETYDYSHPKLNVGKKDFFKVDEGVPYIYDHDTLHLAVAVDKHSPAYNKFKPDTEEVLCCEEMFYKAPYEVKLLSVVEESMVLALERSLVPLEFKPNPDKMFKCALMKVCTSITSGWWRDWSWTHHNEAVKYYYDNNLNGSYMKKCVRQGLKDGVVKLF
jgi:hypothetical protein